MNATNASQRAEIESLRQTEERMQRIGLIVDPAALSPAHRRVSYARRRLPPEIAPEAVAAPGRIGFPYPTAR